MDELKTEASSSIVSPPKRKRGRPPKNKSISEKKSYEFESKPTELLIKTEPKKDDALKRKSMVNFEQVKEILMQNIKKKASRSFTQYTKALVKQYMQNPQNNKDRLRGLSQYLFRANTLYRKIILYYACMPLYNYYLIEKIDLSKTYNASKSAKKYNSIIQKLHQVNFKNEFAQMVALAILDGAYFGFVYDTGDSLFFHSLDPQYCNIKGKENGNWVFTFDMSYFSIGSNSEFVEGIDGDTSGCWDDVFVQAWKEYQSDKQNKRYAILPSEKTICLNASLEDEFDLCLPFFIGVFLLLMDCDDYAEILADKTALENYKLLVSKIPLNDGKDGAIDDFKISLELTEVFQSMLEAILPSNVGAVRSPMDLDVISFEKSNTTDDTDMLSRSIENVFNNCGASQLVVAGGSSTNSIGLKQAIANDASLTFLWISRLESAFNYWLSQNGYDGYTFSFHRQTWYNREDYINTLKESATLGNNPLLYLTALGQDPYEVECGLRMTMSSRIRDYLVPLKTTYTDSSNNGKGGAPSKGDDITEGGLATRDGDKNAGTKANG